MQRIWLIGAAILVLSACGGGSSDNDATDPPSQNTAPSAHAGADQQVTVGEEVTLSGAASVDADGDLLSYAWRFISRPDGSSVELGSGSGVSATFIPDVAGTYVVGLVVNDGTVDSETDSVQVTASAIPPANNVPVADAGADQDVRVGEPVTLSAAASADADGDPLSYAWSIVSRPGDSAADLVNATSMVATLTPDAAGNYLVSLVVNDGAVDSEADTVLISASAATQSGYSGSGSVTRGLAATTVANLFPQGSRTAALGTIDGDDGQSWTVPADNRYQDDSVPFASDLHNTYVNGHDYADAASALAALDGSDIVEVDADGEVVTAYVFGDNYFEMYVNGVAVGKDPVPFTEFNSSIVRFRVNPPFSVAMLLVDWEENLGTGTEAMGNSDLHPGDGGMVAVFKDAGGETIGVTDAGWKAQTYYTAPVSDLACLSESGRQRLSSGCSTDAPADAAEVYGVHWAQPADWMSEAYDDSAWPQASTYANATVGVDNKPAYTHFTDLFDDATGDAEFIWSSNLVLDNEVLVRGTIGSGLQLSSKAVKPDLIVPLSATCDGADRGTSIPLSWSGAPAGTQSYALTMHHFPNPNDAGDYTKAHSYWTVYDIPAATDGLAEGQTDVGVFGINSVDGQQSYAAPCSQDSTEHAYTITLYALSAPVGSLGLTGSTTDLATLVDAVAGSTLDTVTLALTRSRYNPNADEHVPTRVATTCAGKSEAFAAYADYVNVDCDSGTNTFTVTTKTLLPYRSGLDGDKPNVGIRSWIGRVPIPEQLSWTLPMVPTYLSGPTSNVNIHDAIGISVEGIPILHYAKEASPDEIAQLGTDYSGRDTVLLGEVDQCGGHAGNGEDYHYHTAPFCLMDSHDPSQPLAYMFDGLPLYFGTAGGVYTEGGTDYGAGRYAALNYLPQAVKDGTRSLDECNAYDLHGDGSEYVYYSTAEAPYAIGCYRAQADQRASVPGGPHWTQERELSWAGSDVVLTDYDTMSFQDQSWQFIEITPGESNNRIADGDTALIMYRPLTPDDSGYDPNYDCYGFRYRIDSDDTTGAGDSYAVHCR